MTDDKVTEIMVRLERLDQGQRYVIEQLGHLRTSRELDQSTIDKVANRVDRMEWTIAAQAQRARPWRHLAFSVGASVLATIITYVLLHWTR